MEFLHGRRERASVTPVEAQTTAHGPPESADSGRLSPSLQDLKG